MRTIATRTLASVLAALLAVSCGTVRESRSLEIEERVFLPRVPRVVASPVLEELEVRRVIEALLRSVDVEEARAELRRLVADPRFHDRPPGDLRVVLASWGSGPVALEQISREYRAWCTAVRRVDCQEGPLTASSIYEIAFDFAMGAQWDGFVGEVKTTIDPSTVRIVLLTGLVIFMATIAIPELVSKTPAAAATMILTAYLGARAVCDLVFGWIQMVRELDAATTFNEVRAAGLRYGRLVGTQTARVLILLATAAIAQGGLIARLMKLPRAPQASAALAAETGGVGLEVVGAVKEVRVLQGGVAITIEGVAMAAHDPLPGTSSGEHAQPVNRPWKTGVYHGPKPAYENPGHHDPTSGRFRGDGERTTVLPEDAEEVYRTAIPDQSGKTWYGRNAHGEYYRYSGSNGRVHWNGRTESGRGIEVPRHIRERFEAVR